MIDKNPYYTHPVQCAYWNGKMWKSGIVFHETVIDGTTGEAISAAECATAAADKKFDDWIMEFEWYDLNKKYLNEGMRIV